jgi:single-strand DNA-binding protein
MTGRVGSDVERRDVREGLMFASFRLACTPRLHRAGEWVDADTTWITVDCVRALAENVLASISKGDPVIVVGRLRTHAWVDATGIPHERLTIEAASVGHDLTVGRTAFERVRPSLSRPESVELGDSVESVESVESIEEIVDAVLEAVA